VFQEFSQITDKIFRTTSFILYFVCITPNIPSENTPIEEIIREESQFI